MKALMLKNNNAEQVQEVYQIIKSMAHNREESDRNKPDHFDMFGDIVARKLRHLRTRYPQVHCTTSH